MREILTALLDDFCAEDTVKAAAWWEAAPDTRAGVSKSQKIKYFIVGPQDFPIQAEVGALDDQIETAKRVHNEVTAVAHRKVVDRETARIVLISLEDAIGNLLGQRERVAWMRTQMEGGDTK
jgi:hypothetical protein